MSGQGDSQENIDPKLLLNGRSPGQTALHYMAGQTICQQGDPAGPLFYIERGVVTSSVVSPTGKPAIVGLRSAGDFFGVRSLISVGEQRFCTVSALTVCTIIRIERSAMSRLLYQWPEFGKMFVHYLLRQYLRDQENIVSQLTSSAEERLARLLLHLANVNVAEASETIKLDQAALAGMIGTTRPRVSVFMNKFRRRGLIEYNRNELRIARDALIKALGDMDWDDGGPAQRAE